MGLYLLQFSNFLLIGVFGVIGSEYRMLTAGQNFVQNNANSPNVDTFCVLVLGEEDLRRHVDASAAVTTDVTRLIFHAQTKIHDLQRTEVTVIFEHDVCGFQVPMHDAVIMDEG